MMDIFDSDWLVKMLDKSSNTPQGRILCLFDILQDWLDAQNIQISMSQDINSYQKLISFIEKQAIACKAESPNHLAMQIVLFALTATFEEMNHPGKGSLSNAKVAGHALIAAHTRNNKLHLNRIKSNHFTYALAASLILMIVNIAIWLPEFVHSKHSVLSLAKAESIHSNNPIKVRYPLNEKLSPIEVSTMYDKYERLRNGICQYPEVLSIPNNDRAIYLENVVGGQLPKNTADMKTTNIYLEKVNCYYSPFLNTSF